MVSPPESTLQSSRPSHLHFCKTERDRRFASKQIRRLISSQLLFANPDPFFVIWKRGKPRLVVDFLRLNDAILTDVSVSYEDLSQVPNLVRRRYWMACATSRAHSTTFHWPRCFRLLPPCREEVRQLAKLLDCCCPFQSWIESGLPIRPTRSIRHLGLIINSEICTFQAPPDNVKGHRRIPFPFSCEAPLQNLLRPLLARKTHDHLQSLPPGQALLMAPLSFELVLAEKRCC